MAEKIGAATTRDHYFKWIIIFLLFLLLSFDRDLAMIYILIMIGDYIWFKSDNFISFPLWRRATSSAKIMIEAAAAFGAFLFISTVLLGVFSPQSLIGSGVFGSAQSIFQLLATSTPVLQGSKILTFISWGILVPIIETTFFNGRLLEGITTYAEDVVGKKISLKKISGTLLFIMVIVASLFTLFHITAKGITTIPLLITFIFSILSSLLVVRQQELSGAITLHIATNSAAVASSLGWL